MFLDRLECMWVKDLSQEGPARLVILMLISYAKSASALRQGSGGKKSGAAIVR
jgi:hypothetical protein